MDKKLDVYNIIMKWFSIDNRNILFKCDIEIKNEYIFITLLDLKTFKNVSETWLNSFIDELDLTDVSLYMEHLLSKVNKIYDPIA